MASEAVSRGCGVVNVPWRELPSCTDTDCILHLPKFVHLFHRSAVDRYPVPSQTRALRVLYIVTVLRIRFVPRNSSPKKKTTPLATTSDLLISLESSDEEDGAPSTQGGRQSMPYSQHPRSREQQMVRRQTAEGHVSPPKATTTALVAANGNGSAGAHTT